MIPGPKCIRTFGMDLEVVVEGFDGELTVPSMEVSDAERVVTRILRIDRGQSLDLVGAPAFALATPFRSRLGA